MWETSQPEGKLSIRTLKSIPSCRYLRFMSSLITRAALAFILSLISAGSAFAGPSTKSRFDGAKALMLLKDLTEFGQRYPGAPKRDKAIEKQAAFLRRTGATVELQKFQTTSPIDGKSYPFANIIGRFYPQRPKRVLLGTHFDTRQVADLDAIPERRETPIAGANDGTSGVAFSSNWQSTCLRFLKTSGLVLISCSLMLKILEPAKTFQALVEVPNIMLNN